ncbi:MAG: hypothetical protein Q9224_004842 [Gallowayella concinna]
MYNILLYGVTAAVLAVLGLFHREILLQTITSGDANIFTATTWENLFTNKSLVEMGDASVAFFADRFVPAIIPGSISTGRPYIVSLSEKANVTVLNPRPLNTSDPVVLMSLIKASMHVDREPFTWIQGFLSVALASIFIFMTILFVGLVIWYGYRSQSKILEKINTTLLDRISQLHLTIAQHQTMVSFVTRLCTLKTSEPLIQLKEELPAAGQIPCLPNLISHIDFVLHIIDTADSNNENVIRSQRSLAIMREERDAAVSKSEDLTESLAQKTHEFDEVDAKLKKANASHESLQSSLNRKTADFNAACGERDEANKKCRVLESKLGHTQHKLQAAELFKTALDSKSADFDNVCGERDHFKSALDSKSADFNNVCGERDHANKNCGVLESRLGSTQVRLQAAESRLHTILYGATDIEDACDTSLPDSEDDNLKVPTSTASRVQSPASGFNPTTQPFLPEQAKQVRDQLTALHRPGNGNTTPLLGSQSIPITPRLRSRSRSHSALPLSHNGAVFPINSTAQAARPSKLSHGQGTLQVTDAKAEISLDKDGTTRTTQRSRDASSESVTKFTSPPQEVGTGPTAVTGIKEGGLGRDNETDKTPPPEPVKNENNRSSPSRNNNIHIPTTNPTPEGPDTNVAIQSIEERDRTLPSSKATTDSSNTKTAPTPELNNIASSSIDSTPARGRTESRPSKPALPPSRGSPIRSTMEDLYKKVNRNQAADAAAALPPRRGSPIRSTMGDLYEKVNRNQAADAAAALYGGMPQSSDKDSWAESRPSKPALAPSRGSPIRSTMEDLYEKVNRNQAADAAAALYGGMPQSSDNDSPFVQPQLRDRHSDGRRGGSSSSRNYNSSGYHRGGRSGRGHGSSSNNNNHNNNNRSGLQAPPGVDNSVQASFERLQKLIRESEGSGGS